MRILIVTQNFPPDIGGASIRLSGYAEHLTRLGHEVCVLCASPVYPRGKIFKGYKNKWFQREAKNGYEIIRTWIWPVKPSSSFFLRILSYNSFVVSACFGLLKIKKSDLTISAMPSFFASFIGIFNKKLRGGKLILDITDVWPDSAIATGFMKKNFMFFVAKKIEHWIYKQANHVTCVSLGVKNDLLKNKVLLGKIDIIPDTVDVDFFKNATGEKEIKDRFPIDGKFVVGFAGLMGFAQNVKMIALAAQKMLNYKNIVFLLVGDGGLKKEVEDYCKKNNLTNVIFAGESPYSDIPKYLKCFDVGVIAFKNDSLLKNAVPSKLFNYWAGKKPVIINLEGLASDIIRSANGGIICKEDDSEDMAKKILFLYNNRKEIDILGTNGQNYVFENYSRTKIMQKLNDIISSVAGQNYSKE